MRKKIIGFLITIVILFMVGVNDVFADNDGFSDTIHSIYQLNQISSAKDDHYNDNSNSYLELDYRSNTKFASADLPTTTIARYPRIKHLTGNYYLLTYQRAENGSNTYYQILKWNGTKFTSESKCSKKEPGNCIISQKGRYKKFNVDNLVQNEFSEEIMDNVYRYYTNADEVVYAENGKIKVLVIEAFRYTYEAPSTEGLTEQQKNVIESNRDKYTYDNYPKHDGLVMKRGTFNDKTYKIDWEEINKCTSERRSTYKKDGTCDKTELIILRGNAWEPSIVKNENKIDVYFSAVSPYGFNTNNPIKKGSSLKSSGVGLLQSIDNGNSWLACDDTSCDIDTATEKDSSDTKKDRKWWHNVISVYNNGVAQYYAKRISQQSVKDKYTIVEFAGKKFDEGKKYHEKIKNKDVIVDPKRIFTNQMPVATLLNNGKTALAMESEAECRYNEYIDKKGNKGYICNRLPNGNRYNLSFGILSGGQQWTSLKYNQTGSGTSTKQSQTFNVFEGSGPYIRQFPSGEIILTYSAIKTSEDNDKVKNVPKTRVLLSDSFTDKLSSNFDSKNFLTVFGDAKTTWSNVELFSSHVATISTAEVTNNMATEKSYAMNLLIKNALLNHTIKSSNYVSKGDWDDRSGDALFIGSESQAQMSIRAENDNNNIYILSEVLDNTVDSKDAVTIYLSSSNGSNMYKVYAYRNASDKNVYVQKYNAATKAYESISSVDSKKFSVLKKNPNNNGYKIEFTIPRSLISGNNIKINGMLGNGAVTDTISFTDPKDYNTWIKLKLSDLNLSVTGNPTKWTKDDGIYLSIKASDTQSKITQITVTDGTVDNDCSKNKKCTVVWESQNGSNNATSSYKVIKNGTYTVEVTDDYQNKITKTIVVNKFDKVAPSIAIGDKAVSQSTDQNGSVTIPIKVIEKESGIKSSIDSNLNLIKIKVAGNEVSPKSKTVKLVSSSGGVNNYNLILSGIDASGRVTATFQSGAAIDVVGNTSASTDIDLKVTVSRKYSLTYNSTFNGGSTANNTTTVVEGSNVDLKRASSKSGYEFVGWNTDQNATSALSSYKMPAKNVTLYAIYKKTLTATFNYYNSKSETKSVTIYNKATSGNITSPAALGTPSGYTFRHYSTSSAANASKTIDANNTVTLTKNVTYYASYKKNVDIRFYYHSGTNYYNNAQTYTTVTGVQYIGYNGLVIDSQLTTPDVVQKSTGYYGATYHGVAASANSHSIASVNTSRTAYYAFYVSSVKFHYYDGSNFVFSNRDRIAYSDGSKYVVQISNPAPTSFDNSKFKGWSAVNNKANIVNSNETSSLFLYAVYEKEIPATFNYYDGTKAATITINGIRTYIIRLGGTTTINPDITVPDAVKANRGSYTYRGVSTSSVASAQVKTPTTLNNTYYASYSQPIKVKYDANGGVGTVPSESNGTAYMNYAGVKKGILVTTSKNPFTFAGYEFGGWNTNSDGTGINYNENTQYEFKDSATLFANKSVVDTSYKVIHKLMNLDGSTYKTEKEETIKTKSGTNVTPAVNYYIGFTSPKEQTKLVLADGSTEIIYNYERNKYSFNLNNSLNINVNGSTVSGDYYYGSTIKLNATLQEGIVWDRWITPNISLIEKPDSISTSFIMPDYDVEVMPGVSLNSYTISYDLNGGTLDEENPSKYSIEDNIIIYNSPSKVGYKFTGWTGSNGEIPELNVTINKGSTGNKTYKANYELINYAIEYDLDGGTLAKENPNTYTIESNITLNNPVKDGYKFIGWESENSEMSKNVTIPKGSIGNKKYKAHWEIESYTIEYNLDGGTLAQDIPESYTMYDDTISLDSPEKVGYTFIGWTGSNGNTPEMNVSINKGSTGNKSYKANYELINYTIEYDLDGGTLAKPNPSTYTIRSNIITLNNPEKIGNIFAGWELAETGEISNIVSIESGSIGNKKYIAHWINEPYTIEYDLNGGTLEKENPYIYTIDTEDILLNNPTKYGYEFIGWTGSNGSTPEINVKIIKGSTEDKSFVANYKLIDYKINYDLNGGALEKTNPETYTIDTGDILLNNPIKSGYEFTGWSLNDSDELNKSVIIPKGSSGDRNYVAHFEPISYRIEYDLNDGTLENDNPTSYTIESDEIVLNNPSKIGYTFIGWTGSNGKTPELNVRISKGSINDKNYTANWIERTDTKYTIKYYLQDINSSSYSVQDDLTKVKTGVTESTVIIDSQIEKVKGFTFEKAKVDNKEVSSTNILADGSRVIELYYSRNKYTITLKNDDGIKSVNGSGTYSFGESVTIDAIEKDDYEFTKWVGSNEVTEKRYTFIMPDANLTYTAQSSLVSLGENIYMVRLDSTGSDNSGTTRFYYEYDKSAVINGTEVYYYNDSKLKQPLTNGVKVAIPSKKGYTFDGYYSKENGSGIKYVNSDGTIINDRYKVKDNSTLYANWKSKVFTIKLNNSDDSYISDDERNNRTNTIYLKYGDGIYLDSDLTKKMTYTTNKIVKPNITYKIKYHTNFSEEEDEINDLSVNYEFDGYYDGNKKLIDSDGLITKEFTNKYFSENSEIYLKAATKKVELPIIERYEYAFDGWYTEQYGGTKIDNKYNLMNNKITDIYACWLSKPLITSMSNDWTNDNVTISLLKSSYSDSGKIKYQYYLSKTNDVPSKDDIGWNDVISDDNTVNISTNGKYYIFYKAISSNNAEIISNYETVKIDKVKPTINLSAYKKGLNVTVNSNEWTNSYLEFKFGSLSSGPSGGTIYYCIGENCIPSIPISPNTAIPVESTNIMTGIYKVRYRAVSGAGTLGDINEFIAKVDTIKPTIKVENVPTKWVSEARLKISIKDQESGVKYLQVSNKIINAKNNEVEYIVTKNGTFDICAVDNVNNKSEIEHVTINYIDNEKPSKPKIISSSKSGSKVDSKVSILLEGSTALSGIKGYEYSINDGKFDTYNITDGIQLDKPGKYKVLVRSVSNSGLKSDTEEFTIEIQSKQLKVIKSTDKKVNEDIIVKLVSDVEIKEANSDWTLSDDKKELTKTFSENTSKEGELVRVVDINGIVIEQRVIVDNIDKEKPKLLDYVNEGTYKDMTLNFDKKITDLTVVKDGKKIEYKIGSNKKLTEPGNYIITAKDEANNISTYNITLAKNGQHVESKNTNYIYLIIGLIVIIFTTIFILFVTKRKNRKV